MRALRVLGMAEDGENLLCEDTVTGEVFSLRSDERLRAAARGELTGTGRRSVETDPQLRPREIQARVRAGRTVAEVAAEAVTSVSRIESYAYPVMLERRSMADKARAAHPMIDGNPTRKTLEELVTATLRQRGHAEGMRWDAYRPDDAGWLVAVHWHAGRSDNHATWEIHTGNRTTTLRARDDAARELLDPAPRPLRTIAEDSAEPVPAEAATAFDQLFGEPAARPAAAGTDPRQPEAARHPAGTRRPIDQQPPTIEPSGAPAPSPSPGGQPDRQAAAPTRRSAEMTGTDPNPSPTRTARRQRPVMPGWEDVLLGGPSKG
jgi:Protein of unknown function (DUF3071)